jgi:ankyrin repeat protein
LKIFLGASVPLCVVLLSASLIASLSASSPRLSTAIQNGDTEAVRTLLKDPAEVNAAEADGTTPLHWAVRADDLETSALLLKAGAKPGAANRYGVTPLSLAAVNGNDAIVRLLLDAGADANTTVTQGQTVLMVASRTGNPDAVRALLDKGANVNARETQLGETALMWAASENHAAAAALLIQRGADINARSSTITFPKDRFGLEGVLTILPHGSWTPLMYAGRDGGVDVVPVLVKAGADVNAVDPDGTTPLMLAIMNSHYDTANALLENGADPNITDKQGMAALYAAVDMSSLGEVYGLPPRKVRDTLTPTDLMSRLIAKGAIVDARLKGPTIQRNHTPGEPLLGVGTTPLMRAARNGDYKAVKILLDAGADPTLKQPKGGNALMMSSGVGRGLGVFAKDVGTESDLRQAAELLIAKGVDVNLANDDGLTAVHIAAQAGLDSVVTLLARHGARLDTKDKRGRTPVDMAMGVGGRGRAGGPPPVYERTAALIKKLMSEPPDAAPLR